MKKPLVSVIIPTYNRANSVVAAINSVLNQTYTNFELIVVDDGSTDNTSLVLEVIKNKIKYIKQDNSGVSAARNTGIKMAAGEWIAFLDSDDVWTKDKLDNQIKDVLLYPQVVASFVDAMILGYGGNPISTFKLRGLRNNDNPIFVIERPLKYVLEGFFTSTWLIKKSALVNAGCFNEAYSIYEDLDILSKISLIGPFVVNSYEGTYMQRIEGQDNLSNQHQEKKLMTLTTLINIYELLISDSNTNKIEKKILSDKADFCQLELLKFHRRNTNFFKSLGMSLALLRTKPCTKNFIKVILIQSRLDFIFKLKNTKGFRRSDMDSRNTT